MSARKRTRTTRPKLRCMRCDDKRLAVLTPRSISNFSVWLRQRTRVHAVGARRNYAKRNGKVVFYCLLMDARAKEVLSRASGNQLIGSESYRRSGRLKFAGDAGIRHIEKISRNVQRASCPLSATAIQRICPNT